MENNISDEIAESLDITLGFLPFQTNPLDKHNIVHILRQLFIPREPQSMRFKVEPVRVEGIDINSQYNEKSSKFPVDIVLAQIVTNYDTGYKPWPYVRAKRKKAEKEFYAGQEKMNEEVLCRLARTDSRLRKLFNSSFEEGYRYSALAFVEPRHSKQKYDYQWPKIPIFAIPGIYSPVPGKQGWDLLGAQKRKIEDLTRTNEQIAERIISFGLEHQRPTAALLEGMGYSMDVPSKK